MITFPRLGQSGRLGNQLWQIASTVGMALDRGEEPMFPKWDYQPYFSVPERWFGDCRGGTDAAELAVHLDPRARVYLQDFHLWEAHRDLIWDILQPSSVAHSKLVKIADEYFRLPRPVLNVHVRRGDNATAHLRNEQGNHPLRPTSYYRQAMAMLPHRSLAFFSDDIPWCRQEFADLDAFFFEGGDARPKEHEPEYHTAPVEDWIDLLAMIHGDAFVLSNSTYSWWGAFLSGVPGDAIIAPRPWFGPKLGYLNADLMFPSDWIRLDHG